MGDILTLDSVVKNCTNSLDSSPDVKVGLVKQATEVLKKIPKNPLPIESKTREAARVMYAENKYEQIDLSFLTQTKTQKVDFSQKINKQISINLNSLQVPVFGTYNIETDTSFILFDNGYSNTAHLLSFDFPLDHLENKTNSNFPFSIEVNYSPKSDLVTSLYKDLQLQVDGVVSTSEDHILPFDFDKIIMSLVNKQFENAYNRYKFPDLYDQPLSLELPDDVRTEYLLAKKLTIFDAYYLIYETKEFSLSPVNQFHLMDLDPLLIGYLNGNNSYYLMKKFLPTFREDLASYVGTLSGRN